MSTITHAFLVHTTGSTRTFEVALSCRHALRLAVPFHKPIPRPGTPLFCAPCAELQALQEARARCHDFDGDGCCVKCGFDGAEFDWWKRHTYEGRASDVTMPECKPRSPQ